MSDLKDIVAELLSIADRLKTIVVEMERLSDEANNLRTRLSRVKVMYDKAKLDKPELPYLPQGKT